jgi:hypothetical protein
MSSLHLLISLLEQIIIWMAIIVILTGKYLEKIPYRVAVMLGMLVSVVLVQIHGLSASEWLRSVTGDLSITGMLLFADIVLYRLWRLRLVNPESRYWLFRGIIPAGLMFYPLALGMTEFDPYAWGYAPVVMVLAIAGMSLWAWKNGLRNLAVILLLPVLAFHLKLLESPNLWDYLLDPIVFVYALFQGLKLPGFRKI